MNDFFVKNGNGNIYQLKDGIINKLRKMDVLLDSLTNGKELINLAYDIALILHTLKINQRMIYLDNKMISSMVNKLSNINTKS